MEQQVLTTKKKRYPLIRAQAHEIWVAFNRPAVTIVGIFGTLAGILSAFEPHFEFLIIALYICLPIFAIGLVFSIIYAIVESFSHELTQGVKLSRRALVGIKSGDYIKSLKSILGERLAQEKDPNGLVAVLGFSQTGNLKVTSKGCAMMALLQEIAKSENKDLTNSEKFFSIEELFECEAVKQLQKDIIESAYNAGVKRMTAEEEASGLFDMLLPLGSCLITELPLSALSLPSLSNKERNTVRLLLVANSHPHNHADFDTITGPQSLDIIPRVFERLSKENLDQVLMPALGSHRLNNSCQSVISSIVTQYLATIEGCSRNHLFDMTITLRETDLTKSNTSLVQIKRYVRDAIMLFSE